MRLLFASLLLAAAATLSAQTPCRSGENQLVAVPGAVFHAQPAPQRASGGSLVMSDIDMAALTDWQPLGQALYTDDIFTARLPLDAAAAKNPLTYAVAVEQSAAHPGLYRLVNPYGPGTPLYDKYNGKNGFTFSAGAHYLYINAADPDAVYVFPSPMPFRGSDGQACTAISDAYGHVKYDPSPASTWENYISLGGYGGTLRDGIITIPAAGAVWLYIDPIDELYGYYANANGRFKVKLPGATDYSVQLKASSVCHTADFAVNAVFGSDAVQYKGGVVQGGLTQQLLDAVMQAAPLQLADFDNYATAFRFAQAGLPTKEGKLSFVAVTYDRDGNSHNYASASFYCCADDDAQWRVIAQEGATGDEAAMFTDGLAPGVFRGVKQQTYAVEVSESLTRPGLYRIKNPWGAAWPMHDNVGNSFVGHENHNHYLYIDATDPDHVYMRESPMGFATVSGEYVVSSVAARLIEANGLQTVIDNLPSAFGRKEGRTISWLIPAGHQAPFLWTSTSTTNYYYCDTDADTRLVLPAATGIAAAEADDAPAIYYNLQGQRILHPQPGQVVVCRKGGEVRKTIAR